MKATLALWAVLVTSVAMCAVGFPSGCSRQSQSDASGKPMMPSTLASSSSAPAKATTSSPTSTATIPGLKEFGQKEGKSVDKGFVFVDGRYIEAPYTVSRKGVYIYINGIEVNMPYMKMDVNNDPGGPPADITEKTTFEDVDGQKYIDRHDMKKYLYLNAKYWREYGEKGDTAQAKQKMIDALAEYYSKYPCVESATDAGEGTISIKFKNGYVLGSNFVLMPADDPWACMLPDEYYIKGLDDIMAEYERNLADGHWLFFESTKDCFWENYRRYSSADAAKYLPIIIEIAQSNMSRKEKITKIFLASDRILKKLVDNFKSSKQLAERLEALKSAHPEVKPITMADIPTVEQWEEKNGDKVSIILGNLEN